MKHETFTKTNDIPDLSTLTDPISYPLEVLDIPANSYKHFIIPIKGEMVDMLFTKTADCNIYYNTCFTTNHSVINNS